MERKQDKLRIWGLPERGEIGGEGDTGENEVLPASGPALATGSMPLCQRFSGERLMGRGKEGLLKMGRGQSDSHVDW